MTKSNNARPNVLFLCADMIAAGNFGCYGDPAGTTPNIDALAARSTVFDNAYCACPPCIPARVSMMSGQYARTHGKLAHVRMELTPRPPLIPELLSEHGYQTALVGKTHWWPPDDPLGCDQAFITIDNGLIPELGDRDAYIQFLRSKGLFDYAPEGDWVSQEVMKQLIPDHLPEECLRVNWTGTTACSLIEQMARKDDPFFLFCSFVEPHTHNSVTQALKKQFADVPVRPVITRENELDEKPQAQQAFAQQIRDRTGGKERDWEAYRRGVYASVHLMDRNIGRILDKLDELGLTDDTLIVFTSDHGDLMGDHGLVEKTFLYENAINVPFLLKRPTQTEGERCPNLVSHVDLLPTILDACGLDDWRELPIEGRSIVPVLDDPRAEWRDTIYCEVGQTHCRAFDSSMIKMVRRGPWKYLYTLVDGHRVEEELYDLDTDPGELYNVAADNPEKVHELRKELLRWMTATEANRIRPLPENAKWNKRPYQVPKVERRWL